MERQSFRRKILTDMYNVFTELNQIPHDKRKEWGRFGTWENYDFMLTEINKEISRLDSNLRSVTQHNKKTTKG